MAPQTLPKRSLQLQSTVEDCMHVLLHKLHLLKYKDGFYGSKYGSHRPMLDHRFFLAGQYGRGASDQFFTFINLASWLIDQFDGSNIGPVKEGSDPAEAVQRLLAVLATLNFDIPPGYTTARLQLGSGEEVCGVLNGLVDWALEKQNFDCAQPVHHTDNDDADIELAEVCQEADMTVEGIACPPTGGLADDHDLASLAPARPTQNAAPAASDDTGIITSTVDREQWDLEYQQVLPHLQIRVAAEARDFRAHLEAASEQMQRIFPDDDLQRPSLDNKAPAGAEAGPGLPLTWAQTKRNLQHTQNEIAELLAKITTREDLLNDQFAAQMQGYQNQKQRHIKRQEAYEAKLNEVGELVSELQKCMDLVEDRQGELDDRSLKNTGGVGPTTRARQAITDLQGELKHMEVKLGVARQQLVHMDHKHHTQQILV